MLFRSFPSPTQPTPIPSPPTPPPEFALADPSLAVVGDHILYWWPDDGWQHGTVVRECRRSPFSHVVRYRPPGAAIRGDVDSLLDLASYGIRWARLTPRGSPPLQQLRL